MNVSATTVALGISGQRRQLVEEVKAALIKRLSLSLAPEDFAEDTPLFGTGLGLDSMDALEVAYVIEAEFDVTVADEDLVGFRSVNRLVDFVQAKRNETRQSCD